VSYQKSDSEVTRLVKDVLLNPKFRLEDLNGFNAARENQHADLVDDKLGKQFLESDVKIDVPSGDRAVPSQKFAVPGLLYRTITSVICSAFAEPLAARFHFSPYRLFHQSPTANAPQRVYSELYDSDVFLDEHDKVQRAALHPDDLGCKHERTVAALMFWSDSTHLTNFGNAKMWPVYMMFGNMSKYICALPNLGACHHIAYIPSLSDSFLDKILHSLQNGTSKHNEKTLSHTFIGNLCTLYGLFFWMRTSCMHTSMGL